MHAVLTQNIKWITDVEGYLRHHHDMILVTAIEETQMRTIENLEETMEKRMDEEWDLSKRKLMEDLSGKKTGKYQTQVNSSALTLQMSGRKRRGEGINDLSFGFNQPPYSGKSTDSYLSRSTYSTGGATSANKMDEEMRQHSSVIESLNNSRVKNTRSTFDLVTEFVKLSRGKISPNLVNSKQLESFKCWQLLRSMLFEGECESKKLAEEEFSEVYRNHSIPLQSSLAFGSRYYLEIQYRQYVEKTVLKNQLLSGSSPGLLPTVQAYVKYISNSSHDEMFEGIPFWPQVYLCLRCGGWKEALLLLQRARQQGLSSIQECMIQALQFRLSNNHNHSSFPGSCPDSSLELNNLYHRITSSSSNNSNKVDAHFGAVINLLASDGNPNFSDSKIIQTIEDFLWQRLCFIPYTSRNSTSSNISPSASNYTIDQLSETVKRFGPKHFEQDEGKSNFIYFQVLLIAQEFERAVEYLTSRGHVVEAVHVAITLHFYGLLNTAQRSRNNAVVDGSRLLVFNGQGQKPGRPLLNLERLIRQYIHGFHRTNIKEALGYILCLRDRRLQQQLLCELVIETKKVSVCVGKMSVEDGVRTQGLFDQFCSRDMIQDILSLAARHAEEQGEYMDAIDFYLVAGEIETVVSILNTQLSQAIVPSSFLSYNMAGISSSGGRGGDVWKKKAIDFAETYLSQNWAREILSCAHTLGLTFQTLLNLSMFFDMVVLGKYEEALEFMDSLGLVPVGDNDGPMSLTTELYFSMTDDVKRNFHHVLMAYMTCLYYRMEDLKMKERDIELRRFYLNGLRLKARNIVSFAGTIKFQLPEGTNEKLHQMEVKMM